MKLEARFLRAASVEDIRAEGYEQNVARIRASTGSRVVAGSPCGKYALVVTREVKDGKKDLLGIYYYKWDGIFSAAGALYPYSSLFWNQREEMLYWVVVPKSAGMRDADIVIVKLNPLAPLDVPYPEFIDMPMKTWPPPSIPLAKYEHRPVYGGEGYISDWFWTKVDFGYDPTGNEAKIDLVDNDLDGGTLTISYNVTEDAWTRSFAPSQIRLDREAARERDKQRLLRENASPK